MSGKIVRRALVIATTVALAGCGATETANRNSQILNLERLTLKGAMSTEFQNQVETVVHFGFDRDDLDPQARRIVAEQAKWILAHPQVRFAVTGHTDRVGSNDYNMDLGMRRASRVVAALVSLGVSQDRLIARVSKGEDFNIVATENRERLNRRTVTEVIGVDRMASLGNAGFGTNEFGGESLPGPAATPAFETTVTADTGGSPSGALSGDGGDGGAGQDGGGDAGAVADSDEGPGNPGNDNAVGGAGENPNSDLGWGSGSHGRAN